MTDTTKKKITAINSSISKRMSSVEPKLLVTSDYIANEFRTSILDVDAMAKILNVNRQSVIQSISNHTMPFPVTKLGKNWVTTPYDVAHYIIANAQDKGEYAKVG